MTASDPDPYVVFDNRVPSGFSEVDVIVVGSGPSGLLLANLLGHYGQKKVLVLEQHEQAPGGGAQCFRQGKEWLYPGVHYVGIMPTIARAVNHLATDGQRMTVDDPSVIYDTQTDVGDVSAANFEETMGIRHSSFIPIIRCYNICVFVKLLWWPLAMLLWGLYCILGYRSVAGMTYEDWCRANSFKGEKKNEMWWTQQGDHGRPRAATVAAAGAGALIHYSTGITRFEGGMRESVRRMCRNINKRNGCVLVNARVTSLKLDGNNKVSGVVFSKSSDSRDNLTSKKNNNTAGAGVDENAPGFEIKAPVVVICGAHAMTKICEQSFVPSNSHNKNKTPVVPDVKYAVDACGESVAFSFVFLTFEGKTHQDIGIPASNQWIYKSHTPHIFMGHKESETGLVVYILWPSAKYIDHGRSGDDVDEYHRKKEATAHKEFEYCASRWPKLREYDTYDSSTPYTAEKWLGSCRGCSYGLSLDAKRFTEYATVRALRPEQNIPGLFLTGQDMFLSGFMSAHYAALMTAQAVLRPGLFNMIFNNMMVEVQADYLKKIQEEEKKK